MALRFVNGSAILRCCAVSPPPISLRCHHNLCVHSHSSISRRLHNRLVAFGYGGVAIRRHSAQSLVDMVVEELESLRHRGRLRAASNKLELRSSEEILENKSGEQALQKGLLLEFRKDPERVLLAVVQKPDGKKNWMVSDQNGVMTSVKPQQVTFVVPGIKNFDHMEISNFLQKAQDNLDPGLLEFAWTELVEKNKSTTVEELAEMMFGSAEPLESYSAHLLLSKDDVYFTTIETKGSYSVYGPRPAVQVEELTRRKHAKETAERELEEFIDLLKSARDMPLHSKHPKSFWSSEEKNRKKIESLQAYAIDNFMNEDEKRTVGMILNALGFAKTAASAVNLLIDIGYYPVHVNLDLLKLNVRTDYAEEILAAAESLLSESPDLDEVDRKDLTHLKVYAIDVDEADERIPK